MSTRRLTHLLAPGRIGPMALRNRMVVTAMGAALAEDDGSVSDQLIAYHEEQAKGGVGLIIMGATGVAWPVGAVQPNQIAISDDKFIPGLKRLADAVHKHGAKVAAQLHQGGLNAGTGASYGHPYWTPSVPPAGVMELFDYFLPEELLVGQDGAFVLKVVEKPDIELLVRQFADAARRAQAAGLDGVEIHAAHGYILSAFLSGAINKRTDEYGGPLENRARLLMEVFAAVRAATGPDFAVWVKIDWRELGKDGGVTLNDARELAKMLEKAGVDAITVSSSHDMGQAKLQTETNVPHIPETNIPAATAIKQVVNIPVIASGRVEPESADAHIAAGHFDHLAMGRKMLADPHLPRKLDEGRADDVRPCIYCYTCISAIYTGSHIRCAVSPETAFEYLGGVPRQPRRRIVVVGGGPAGMEAARRLDGLGHEVILLEKSERLGGTLRFASLAYEPNERILNWLRGQITKSKVEVRLNTEASPELLRGLRPDEVFVATGAVREMPPIPGGDLDHVFSGDDMRKMMLGESSDSLKRKTSLATRVVTKVGAASGLSANIEFVRKATHQWMPLGDRIVIIGGELVGLELAEFLTERGRKVTVLEESTHFGRGLTVIRRMRMIPELREHGVALHAQAKDIRIDGEGVSFTDAEGKAQRAAADSIIVAKGARGDSAVADAIRAAGFRVRELGDGTGVGYIEGAIRGAANAVRGYAEEALQPEPAE